MNEERRAERIAAKDIARMLRSRAIAAPLVLSGFVRADDRKGVIPLSLSGTSRVVRIPLNMVDRVVVRDSIEGLALVDLVMKEPMSGEAKVLARLLSSLKRRASFEWSSTASSRYTTLKDSQAADPTDRCQWVVQGSCYCNQDDSREYLEGWGDTKAEARDDLIRNAELACPGGYHRLHIGEHYSRAGAGCDPEPQPVGAYQLEYSGLPFQRWKIEITSSYLYRFKNVAYTDRYLGVTGRNRRNAGVYGYRASDVPSRSCIGWYRHPDARVANAFVLRPQLNSFPRDWALEVNSSTGARDARIVVDRVIGEPQTGTPHRYSHHQLWEFIYNGSTDDYAIINHESGLAITI